MNTAADAAEMHVRGVESPADLICARMERLPISSWHTRMRLILGTCTLFDAYDAISIGFVLPVLARLWDLNPGQIGLLLSAGFAGQFIGASTGGWLAQRHGRIRVINWTIWIIAIFGVASGLAWSYGALLAFRFFQGLGVGGENPVGATYINEIAKGSARGSFVTGYQLAFPLGYLLASAASALIVPHFGWRWIYFIGALPIILSIPLRRWVPESPRWLARVGRLSEAEENLAQIEFAASNGGREPLPPVPRQIPIEASEAADWRGLFRGIYLRRTLTVWMLWLPASVIGYGLLNWLPTLFRTIYKMPLEVALGFGPYVGVLALLLSIITVNIVDRIGRKPVLVATFLVSAISLLSLWYAGEGAGWTEVLILAGLGYVFIAPPQLVLTVYTPEIYPTRLRAIGAGFAMAFSRLSTMLAPLLVGWMLQRASVTTLFAMFASLGLLGALIVALFAVEASGRTLEDVSP